MAGDGGKAATSAGAGAEGRGSVLTSGFRRYPSSRSKLLWDKSVEPWIKDKQATDGAEGLWRVHDELYDLEKFAKHHPGGRFWIDRTRGHDITELFESCHVLNTGVPERLLRKYHVRKAAQPRNAPYTFHEDGFYRTLKRRAVSVLRRIGTGPSLETTLVSDTCFCMFVGASVATVVVQSKLLAAVSAMALSLTIGAGHNFFHQRDSVRMFYTDLSFISSAEWRVSHAMSHHVNPNTAFDLEITTVEPIVRYLTEKKQWFHRGLMKILVYQITLPGVFFVEGLKRLIRWCTGEQRPRKENFLPFLHLFLMAGSQLAMPLGSGVIAKSAAGGKELLGQLLNALRVVTPFWGLTHMLASYIFLSIGFAAAHHHPDIYHDGDVSLTSQDWGLQQLNAVGDRAAIRGNVLFVLTTFGDHALHHLFPTVDHAKLKHLYPVFEEVCAEFGVRVRYFTAWELLRGEYEQMERTVPRESNLMAPSSVEKPRWSG